MGRVGLKAVGELARGLLNDADQLLDRLALLGLRALVEPKALTVGSARGADANRHRQRQDGGRQRDRLVTVVTHRSIIDYPEPRGKEAKLSALTVFEAISLDLAHKTHPKPQRQSADLGRAEAATPR